MRTLFVSFSLITLLLSGMAAFTSCKKDSDIPSTGSFDIRNPEGYFLYVKQSNEDGSYRSTFLFEFLPGEMVKIYFPNGSESLGYTVIGDNAIDISGDIEFVFHDNGITSSRRDFGEIVLVKAQERNQLAGKTFTGTYYYADRSTLHPNFFYSFAANGNTVGAGFNPGAPLRTENYQPIGNFAAWAALGNGDIEFLVLVNGKLEVNYKVKGLAGNHYGTFEEQ